MEVAENSGPVNTWKKENSYNVTISKLENGSYNVMLSMYEAAKRHISTEVPIGYFVNMANRHIIFTTWSHGMERELWFSNS